MKRRSLLLGSAFAAAAMSFAAPTLAQTKWDLPAGYPAGNPHTQNLNQFAADVQKATGGKLAITVHPNGALFKAPEIKRAVQTGQAQIGEVLMSLLENENAVVRGRRRAVRGDRLRRLVQAVAGPASGRREDPRRPGHPPAVRSRVAAAGHLHEEAAQLGGRHEGPQVARLQPRHDAHRLDGRRVSR